MQYKRMCVWENSSAASKEKNSIPIFNISQLSNTTLHIYRVFINTSVVTVRNFKNTYIPNLIYIDKIKYVK